MKPFDKPPRGFVIHHSLTQDGSTVSVPAIRKYHKNVKGWSDVGYHAFVELAGAEYEAILGRPMDMEGAHCLANGMNSRTFGVCLIGNFDRDPPVHQQLEVMRDRILVPWARMFSIPLNLDTVTFHRDHAPDRTCPGKAFTKDILKMYLPGLVV